MSTVEIVVLVVAVPTFFACMCRLFMLDPRTDSRLVIGMHGGMAAAVLWAGYHSWMSVADMGDIASVAAVACWIAISYKTWRHGVPGHFRRAEFHWPLIDKG